MGSCEKFPILKLFLGKQLLSLVAAVGVIVVAAAAVVVVVILAEVLTCSCISTRKCRAPVLNR